MRESFFQKVRGYILGRLDLEILKLHPRESVIFARNYFKGKKINVAEIGVLYGDNARNMNSMFNIQKSIL